MYNYKKKEGKLDKIKKDRGLEVQKIKRIKKNREFLIQSKKPFWS